MSICVVATVLCDTGEGCPAESRPTSFVEAARQLAVEEDGFVIVDGRDLCPSCAANHERLVRLRISREDSPAAERYKAEFAHYKVLADSLGFRRAVLELHAPTFEEFGSSPGCTCCYDSEYGADDWPCETYVLARDWTEDAS